MIAGLTQDVYVEGLAILDDRVACVMASLRTAAELRVVAEYVYYLSFALQTSESVHWYSGMKKHCTHLVTPLRSKNHRRHREYGVFEGPPVYESSKSPF